ncbi:hypothetical protein O181_049872 [Austropuccinia psidii MF-1]|uniref:Uncharacterized protein n=1 Tax=Austropuccinia psidii MF-1 TaxID=1389203 RepID=A0A9Q3DXV5_9BASI|nr:hypothetical protein [Austropuccinia psidii MF-1]
MKVVHTRNGSNYSVQPNGSGQGRGKTRARLGRTSSRKTHLEDARVSLHSPRSVLTTSEINSESELIQGNVLRAERLPSGSHVQIYVPVQKLVQRSQGRGMGNFSKPLAGGNELLLTHQELSGSGEDHGTLIRMESLFWQRQSQKYKELVEEQNSFIHRPTEGTGNDARFGERRTSSFSKLQTSFRTVQEQA